MNSVFCADIGTSSLKAALVDFSGRVLAFSRVQFGLFYTDHAAGEWLGALRKALAGCISFVGGGADICATAGTGVSFANTGASGQGTQISIDAICISGNGPTLCGVDGKTLLWNADLGLGAGAGVAGTGCSSGTAGASTANICAAVGTANICATASTAGTGCSSGTSSAFASTAGTGGADIRATADTDVSFANAGASATAGTGGADICATASTAVPSANTGASGTAGTGSANICATAGTGVSFANTGASGQGTQISIDAICISGNGPTLCGVDGKTLLWNADLGAGAAGTGCSSGTGSADICATASTANTDVSFANTGVSDTAGTFGTAASSANTGISGNTANICAAANTASTDVSFANTGASGTAGTFGTAASSANTGISGNTADICATASTANNAVPSANTKSLYIPRILGFAKKFPSYWQQKDCTVFSGPEYLIYLLTGASVSILPEKRFLEAYWSREAFKEAGLSAEDAEDAMQKLPSFVPPASIAGSLTKTAAEFLCGGEGECAAGLVKDGIPVVCGAPDFISALVGTNTLRAGLFCDRAGSSEGINLCTSKPVAGQGIRTLPSIIPGLWNASVLLPESGERFCAYKEKISRLYARPISLDEMVQILLESDGSLAELDQGKYLMLQTAMMVRDGLNVLRRAAEESGAVPALKTEMTVTGGQAENPLWNQMKANVTGYTLYTQSLVHAELTGDAVFALLALGLYKDIHSAAAAVCKREVCYEPQEVS